MTQRIRLNVPYREKDLAKTAGARWDPQVRRWYAPRPGMRALDRWLPQPPPATTPHPAPAPVPVPCTVGRPGRAPERRHRRRATAVGGQGAAPLVLPPLRLELPRRGDASRDHQAAAMATALDRLPAPRVAPRPPAPRRRPLDDDHPHHPGSRTAPAARDRHPMGPGDLAPPHHGRHSHRLERHPLNIRISQLTKHTTPRTAPGREQPLHTQWPPGAFARGTHGFTPPN